MKGGPSAPRTVSGARSAPPTRYGQFLQLQFQLPPPSALRPPSSVLRPTDHESEDTHLRPLHLHPPADVPPPFPPRGRGRALAPVSRRDAADLRAGASVLVTARAGGQA